LHVLRGGVAPVDEAERERPAAVPVSTFRTPAPEAPADGLTIGAAMIGLFYRAPAPGEPPFVEAGTRVEPDTIVGIIEVMKMMNSVPAGITATIVAIHVDNAQPVEYGQPLFRVEPG